MLGISAYNSARKCLSELVANSYDADAKDVRVTLPDVIDENAIITIEDNGIGMSSDEIKNKFLYIGRNRRVEGEKTDSGRLVIGSKGIGKLAGFGISSRIRLTSWKNSQQSSLTIDREALESVDTLKNHRLDIVVSSTQHDAGTKIELLRLHEQLRLPTADEIRRSLFINMPKKADFKMYVNGVECSAQDIAGERHEFSEEISGLGQVTGYYIIAESRQRASGFAVRVRERIVQEPSLFGLDTRAHGFFTAEKICGEIRAEFLDPEASDGARQDLIKTTRDGFLDEAEAVQTFNDWAAQFIRKIVQGADTSEQQRRTDSLLNEPDIKTRLDRLPPHIRGTASKVVRGIISKLKTASDEDAKNLIEWVLRYYESNVLKELMNAIASADIAEAEKLGNLIQEWGLTQVNSVIGIIQTQIDIITRLEELTASDKAKEIDLHKLIESNLWLVREGLELWSSDKPLKTLLEGYIDKLYEGKEDIRPDLVCRSRSEGSEAVILEFKRPKEKVVMDHVTQALEYEGIIRKHRPNISFETFIVGRQYDTSVLAIRDKQEKAGLHLWSFEEILQRTRMRFEKILEILGR
ncbi:ATP-binding protein [Chloroflexota bacterium]